jgi:predicted nucleic acid-binding Zn ribbon protein
MQKKSQSTKSRANTPRVSAQQKKARRQQLLISIIGIVVILAMVLALVATY